MSQYVCVMSHPAFADWSHVAASTVDPERRARELQREYEVDGDFVLEGYVETGDAARVEADLKRRLADAHKSHDFYEVAPLDALAVLAEVPDDNPRIRVRTEYQEQLGLAAR